METSLTGWQIAEFALANKLNRVLLYGPPGTGKTYFGLNYQASKAYRLICTEEMTDADLIGYVSKGTDGNYHWREGIGIRAWKEGSRLVVDEINRANADIESRLMSLIDTVDSSSWENPHTGEIVKPHKDFSVVATMNGEPEDLAPAILDRLVVQVNITTPHPDAIERLPQYLREIALNMCSRTDNFRYSLRNFIEFEKLYSESKDLATSALVALPRIADEIVDALAIKEVEA